MLYKKAIDAADRLNNKNIKLNSVLIILTMCAALCIGTCVRILTASWYSVNIAGGACISIVLFLLALRKKDLKITKGGVFIIAMEMLLGISFIINGILLHVLAYSVIGGIFAVIVPLTQYALASRGLKETTGFFCKAIIIAYYILLVASMAIGPVLTDFKYFSVMGNRNLLGYFMVITVPASIYLLLRDGIGSRIKYFYWGTLISCLTMVFFTSSRTSVLAILTCLAFLMILLISNHKKNKDKKISADKKKIITYIIITLLVPVIMFFMLSTGRKSIIKFVKWLKTDSSQSANSGKEDEDPEEDFSADYFIKGLDGKGDDSFTSGRITIWKEFGKNVGILGHAQEYREIIEETRTYEHANAHNVYLQVAYSAGAAAGAVYLLAVAFIGCSIIVWFVRVIKGKEKFLLEKAAACMFVIGFAVVSLTSDGYMIFSYLPATMFWFSAQWFIFKEKPDSTLKTEQQD